MNKRTIHIISLLIVSVFAFHFMHSELDMFVTQYDHDHYAHDFCHLVDSTSVNHFEYDNYDIIKILPFIVPLIFFVFLGLQEFCLQNFNGFLYPPHKSNLYLRNRLLLI